MLLTAWARGTRPLRTAWACPAMLCDLSIVSQPVLQALQPPLLLPAEADYQALTAIPQLDGDSNSSGTRLRLPLLCEAPLAMTA